MPRFTLVLKQVDSHAHFQLKVDDRLCHSHDDHEICMKLHHFAAFIESLYWPFELDAELAQNWTAIHPYGEASPDVAKWLKRHGIPEGINPKIREANQCP